MWQKIFLRAIALLSFSILSFETPLAQTAPPEIAPTEQLAGDKTGKDAIKRRVARRAFTSGLSQNRA